MVTGWSLRYNSRMPAPPGTLIGITQVSTAPSRRKGLQRQGRIELWRETQVQSAELALSDHFPMARHLARDYGFPGVFHLAQATTSRKIALVIGNAVYTYQSKLPNPANPVRS